MDIGKSPRARRGRDRPRVKVIFYSGYKGEETPRSILLDDDEIPVEEILSRRRVFNTQAGKVLEVFACRTNRGTVTLRELAGGEWEARFS